MRTILLVIGWLAWFAVDLAAQEKGASGTSSAAAGQTGTSTAAASTAKNKSDALDFMSLPAFTNDSGMVMVKLSDVLWVGKYEVTQQEYQKVTGGNPSEFRGDQNPVESVSWNDAMSFCERLTQAESEAKMLPEGFAYSLPTQGQWEALAGGADLKDAVTSSGTSRSGTAAVGSLGPNGAGLHDVRGNVWEWCLDPQDKPFRVARGAAWDVSVEVNLRPEFRWYGPPDDRKNTVGFRCVLIRK